MSWMVFAFAAPVLWAISTHFDKYLVDKYFAESNVAVLTIFTALMGLIALPFIWFFRPDVISLSARDAAIIAFSGMLYMGAILFYLNALQHNEASVVAPFFQSSPLIGYVLAYVFLGETLTPIQIAGGLLIVGGAAFASLKFGSHAPFNARLAILMLGCGFVLAVSSLIFKIFAVNDEFWRTTFWMFAGQAVFGAGMLAIASFRDEFIALLRFNPGPVLSVNGANELINLGGGLGSRYALTLAPLSLVQAVTSTTTIFVFAIGVLLSFCLPHLARESVSHGELVRKGLAAVLVAAGIVLINR